MKVLLITLGSHGDIHPFIAIARSLRERGHQATLATNPYYQPQIEATGIPFAGFTEYVELRKLISENRVMDPNVGPLVVMRKLTLPMVPEFVQRSRELIRELRPDVVVYHPIVFGVPWACELEGRVRTVSISPSPLLWSNPNDPVVLMPWHSDNPGPIASSIDRFVSRWFLRLALDPGLNRVRRSLGMTKGHNHFHQHATGADINLGVWSSSFRAPMTGDPRNSSITGFTWHDRDHTQETASSELSAFLDAGPAPVVVGLGSTGVHASGRFYEHAVDACRALNTRALLIVGRDQPPPSNLPNDGTIKAVQYAPYSLVFPRAAVNVHHGGAGTTAQGMLSGRPTLITPMAHDQFDNAARVRRLGVGDTLHFRKVTVKRLISTLAPLLHDPRFTAAAAHVAPRIAAEDGGRRAAELITA